MRDVIRFGAFFGLAIASMILNNIYFLLAAPIAAIVVSIAFCFLPKRRRSHHPE